ncbi:MAG: hypothetical protein ACO1OD_12900 [Croceibacterium sp.]
MENKQQQPMDYERPTVPPATPPTIDGNADAQAAAELAKPGGDSDFPGQTPAEVQPDEGGDTDYPGRGAPEQQPDEGDIDHPGETPQEMPAQPEMPSEAPPPD